MNKNNKRSTLISTLLFSSLISAAGSVYAASPATKLEYDPNGNITKLTDGLSHATTLQYDAVDRLIQQNQANPSATGQLGQIKTPYNAIDQVTGVTDPRNLGTSYTRNAYGNILTQTSPDTGTTTYTYDDAGNLKTKTDALGNISSYTYDVLNRMTQLTYKPSASGAVEETITYFYDIGGNSQGRLTGMTDMAGGGLWYYDVQGRVIGKQQLSGGQLNDLQIQYNSGGKVSRMIYPSTHYIDYAYNSNGQVNQISVDGVVMISSIIYYPTGTVKSYNWGSGQTYQRKIDSDGRPVSFTMGDQLQVISYDNAGRITQINRALAATPTTPVAGTTSTYSYDNLNRLTNNVTPTTNQGYQYDLNGNRTQLTIGANNYAYTIAGTSNRLSTEAGPTARTYTYDTVGKITGNGQDTYSYFNSGRLKQVTRAGSGLLSQVYNGLGQMVIRNSATGYMYDLQGHLLGEYNSSGDILQENVYLGDIPVLAIKPDAAQVTADNISTQVTGSWTTQSTDYGFYGTNFLVHPASTSSTDKVVFTLTPVSTQDHRIYARWSATSGNATNATYTINTNVPGSTPQTVVVNQQYGGGAWVYLGSFPLNSTYPVTVSLSGQGNGNVIADAIRLIPSSAVNIQNLTYFVQTDHLNTPRVIVSGTNQKRWTWYPEQSEAFGANVPNENPASLGAFTYNLRFPGQIYEPTSQLSYNYYRDYNPRTGRYIESDPIGLEGGINTYAYVNGNPLRGLDPMGLADIVLNPNGQIITQYDNGTTVFNHETATILDNQGSVAGVFPASNNAISSSAGPYQPGVYQYDVHTTHPDDGPNSKFGNSGNFKFPRPDCPNCGFHSGRVNHKDGKNRTGFDHATEGCVRSTDEATGLLNKLLKAGDAPQTLTVLPE